LTRLTVKVDARQLNVSLFYGGNPNLKMKINLRNQIVYKTVKSDKDINVGDQIQVKQLRWVERSCTWLRNRSSKEQSVAEGKKRRKMHAEQAGMKVNHD